MAAASELWEMTCQARIDNEVAKDPEGREMEQRAKANARSEVSVVLKQLESYAKYGCDLSESCHIRCSPQSIGLVTFGVPCNVRAPATYVAVFKAALIAEDKLVGVRITQTNYANPKDPDIFSLVFNWHPQSRAGDAADG